MKIKSKCKECNKSFETDHWTKKIFCSRKCNNINQIGKHNSPKTEFKKGLTGSKSGHWKGGKTICRKGYILIYKPKHPFCNKSKYIREHRYIIEQSIGRFLTPQERVHHINRNKQDNRLKNLMLFSSESLHREFENIENLNKIMYDGKKLCFRCHKMLPLNNFHKNKHSLSGYRPECCVCGKPKI